MKIPFLGRSVPFESSRGGADEGNSPFHPQTVARLHTGTGEEHGRAAGKPRLRSEATRAGWTRSSADLMTYIHFSDYTFSSSKA